jgi:UDP-glucuronate 4-epimerase
MSGQEALVTGAAGFIGFHVAQKLLQQGYEVTGLDNINDYYDPALKQARLAELRSYPHFNFLKMDIADRSGMAALFAERRFPIVIHLAAQAGVRHSIEHPHVYADANLEGFVNILEGCRHGGCRHLLFASSSSVYGANTKVPFSVNDRTDHPVSLYAATKKANELMAYTYSHLYRLPATGLRFFTVYGPWGRPDMAMFIFARAIIEGRPIPLFNHGRMQRDFTYVDDVAEAVVRLIDRPPQSDPDASAALDGPPCKVYNIGNHHPEEVMRVVELLEREFGKVAEKQMLPMQPGDVPATYADIDDLKRDIGFSPTTTIEDGVRNFVAWYRKFYAV